MSKRGHRQRRRAKAKQSRGRSEARALRGAPPSRATSAKAQKKPSAKKSARRTRAESQAQSLNAFIWLLPALFLAMAASVRLIPPGGHDDAYITYRYAANLAEGHGLVFNIGERIYGTTTPLYALILAAGAFLGAPPPWFSAYIEIVSIMAIGMAILLYLRTYGDYWYGSAMFAVMLLCFNTLQLEFAQGMESALYTACLMGVFALMAHERFALAISLSAVAVLLRPDGVLLAPALAMGLFGSGWRKGFERLRDKKTLLAIGLSAAAVLGWMLFAWQYFGSPTPQSMAAKAVQGREAGRRMFWHGALDLYVFDPVSFGPRFYGWFAMAGLAWGAWRFKQARPIAVWLVLYTAIMCWRAPSYNWYYFPLVAAACVGFAHALQGALILSQKFAERAPKFRILAALAPLGVLILGGAQDTIASHKWQNILREHPELRANHRAYKETGLWLRDHMPEGARVGAMEIGLVGYWSRKPILDLMGLVSPEALPYVAAKTSILERTLAMRPEYFILSGVDEDNKLPPDYAKGLDPDNAGDWRRALGGEFARTYEQVHAETYKIATSGPSGELVLSKRETLVFRLRDAPGQTDPPAEASPSSTP